MTLEEFIAKHYFVSVRTATGGCTVISSTGEMITVGHLPMFNANLELALNHLDIKLNEIEAARKKQREEERKKKLRRVIKF